MKNKTNEQETNDSRCYHGYEWGKESPYSLWLGVQTGAVTVEIIVVVPQKWDPSTSRSNSITLRHIPKEHFVLPQRHFLHHGHCCSTHSGQKLDTTYISLNRRIDKV